MKRLPTIPPPPGGAVQDTSPAVQPREQITQMLSPESEREFEQNLPESTAQPVTDDRPRRKRRTKEEMAAIRGEVSQPSTTPSDPRIERAKAKFTSLGAGHAIKAGFSAMGKPLEKSETEDVDDYFLLVGAKGGLDPTQSWVAMFFCALLLIARLVFMRTDLGPQLKGFLFPEEKKDKVNNAENDPD